MTNNTDAGLLSPDELRMRRHALATKLRNLRLGAHPRLSQQAAAAYIGLSDNTGYRSIGQWERGDVVPSINSQRPLRQYLWCVLGLHQQPAEFAALWEEIATVWHWPALTELDWRELRALDCTQTAAQPAESGLLAPAAQSTEVATAAASAALPAGVPVSAQTAAGGSFGRPAVSQKIVLVGLLAAVLALLFLATAAFVPDFIIANPLFRWATSAPKGPEGMGANLDFETTSGLAPWSVVGDEDCALRMRTLAARSGDHLLHVDTNDASCLSLRYDLNNAPAAGTTAHFAVWARAAGQTTESVELALWSGRRTGSEQAMVEKLSTHFIVDREQWRCLEVALPITSDNLDLVRAELYFDQTDPVRIDLDDASIHFGGLPLCQSQPPHPINPGFETGMRHLGWFFQPETSCDWEVITDREGSEAGQRYLRIEHTNPRCASIYQDLFSAPVPGVTYRAAIWVRSAGDQPVRANWMLRMLGGEDTFAEQRLASGSQWRCVETALTAPEGKMNGLRTELYFESPNGAYALDSMRITAGDEPLCPPQPALLNGGFEEKTTAPWEELKQCLVAPTAGAPHSGNSFARVEKGTQCFSVYQDVLVPTPSGATGTFSIWVRAAGLTPARGKLALRAAGIETDLAELPFTLPDNTWTCLEVSLASKTTNVQHWRPEIYFGSDGAVYDMDDASFALDAAGGCPQTNYAIQRLEWLPGTAGYPGSGVSGMVEIENLGQEATTQPHALRYWLAETRNGPALYEEASGAVTVPPVEAGEGSGPLYFDLALPPGLEAGKTYYLVMDSGATSTEVQAAQRRRSLPLALAPCEPDSLFCDIPAGYWAQAEAETWYAKGITSGCRSNTQAYLDLPFCPQQVLSPDTMAVFLVRHLAEPGFNPAQPYRGVYADVPESHRRSLWIETLYDQVGPLTRSNCPEVKGELRFCPQAPLLRADLLRYLALALKFDPASDAAPHYVDLAGDPALSALATALWQAGILPDDDPNCPDLGLGPRFCPQAPALRIDAAVWMVHGFGLDEREE